MEKGEVREGEGGGERERGKDIPPLPHSAWTSKGFTREIQKTKRTEASVGWNHEISLPQRCGAVPANLNNLPHTCTDPKDKAR